MKHNLSYYSSLSSLHMFRAHRLCRRVGPLENSEYSHTRTTPNNVWRGLDRILWPLSSSFSSCCSSHAHKIIRRLDAIIALQGHRSFVVFVLLHYYWTIFIITYSYFFDWKSSRPLPVQEGHDDIQHDLYILFRSRGSPLICVLRNLGNDFASKKVFQANWFLCAFK